MQTAQLRAVKVTFANGDTINTSMAAGLTDEEIRAYYATGRTFNIGSAEDNMQAVAALEILA